MQRDPVVGRHQLGDDLPQRRRREPDRPLGAHTSPDWAARRTCSSAREPAAALELPDGRVVQQGGLRQGGADLLGLGEEPVAQHPRDARRQRRRGTQHRRVLADRAAQREGERGDAAGLDVHPLRDVGAPARASQSRSIISAAGERRHLQVVQPGDVDLLVVVARADRGHQRDLARAAAGGRSRRSPTTRRRATARRRAASAPAGSPTSWPAATWNPAARSERSSSVTSMPTSPAATGPRTASGSCSTRSGGHWASRSRSAANGSACSSWAPRACSTASSWAVAAPLLEDRRAGRSCRRRPVR